MFGARFWGRRFFGRRYWGQPAEGVVVTPIRRESFTSYSATEQTFVSYGAARSFVSHGAGRTFSSWIEDQ